MFKPFLRQFLRHESRPFLDTKSSGQAQACTGCSDARNTSASSRKRARCFACARTAGRILLVAQLRHPKSL